MNLTQMKFRGFTWRHNPTEITVKQAKNIRESILPFSGSKLQDIGMAKRKIEGKGFFIGSAGESPMMEFKRLQEVFMQSGSGMLRLPSYEPFLAVMDRLDIIGSKGAKLVEYSFSFTEQSTTESIGENKELISTGGESLWDYANRFEVSIDAIERANRHIKDINCLKKGERVVIP